MKVVGIDVGVRTLSYCVLHREEGVSIEETINIKKWDVIDVNGKNLDNICVEAARRFDAIPELMDVDTVVIERQPRFSQCMICLGEFLRSYFRIRGMLERQTVQRILMQTGAQKLNVATIYNVNLNELVTLKFNNVPDPATAKASKRRIMNRKYHWNKKAGEELCRHILQKEHPSFLEWFESLKKKDDASDSFLHALYYMLRHQFTKPKKIFSDKKIISRKPTQKQTKGLLSLSNIKYLFQQWLEEGVKTSKECFIGREPKEVSSEEFIQQHDDYTKNVEKAILRHCGTFQAAVDSLVKPALKQYVYLI